jgi:hypothetical protein
LHRGQQSPEELIISSRYAEGAIASLPGGILAGPIPEVKEMFVRQV